MASTALSMPGQAKELAAFDKLTKLGKPGNDATKITKGMKPKAPKLPSEENPFHMPSDQEVFASRDAERAQLKKEKEERKNMSIYAKSEAKRRHFKDLLAEISDRGSDKAIKTKNHRDLILLKKQAGDRQFSKENLQDFIAKKREMFLVQYALGVKREEMKKLENIVQAEEQKLLDDEKALEEDAAKFDAFLKENDKNSVEAMKRAEMETKAKLEKMQEIKKLNAQIMAIRSDMSKNEDQLKDYQRYREFLEKLTPAEWFAELNSQNAKKKDQQDKKKAAAVADDANKTNAENKPKKAVGAKKRLNAKSDETEEAANISNAQEDNGYASDDSDYDDEAPLYFSHPQQMLDIFAELEENNLSLIQNCQETEETLEELRQKTKETETRMEKATQSLRSQIDFLESAIKREEEKAHALEERAKFFSLGAIGTESQEELLEELNHKVKEVYHKCIGDNDANISTLQMLTNIENKLEHLFEMIEMMPPEKVEQAEKLKDKERRQRLREEKMDAQRLLQEERVQRALERARAPVKKKVGKPLVFRSAPPQRKKKKDVDDRKKEEEDLEFYFRA